MNVQSTARSNLAERCLVSGAKRTFRRNGDVNEPAIFARPYSDHFVGLDQALTAATMSRAPLRLEFDLQIKPSRQLNW